MEVLQAVIGLLFGLVTLFYSSEKIVNLLIKLGSALGTSTFTVGFIIASVGTDMPEIVNSLISSYLNHSDISVGDSFGSVLTQISLVIVPCLCVFLVSCL